jgi:hypothetical protein
VFILPFLKKNGEGSASAPVQPEMRKPDGEEEFSSRRHAAREVMDAFKSDNLEHFDSALKAYIELCDEEPHQEGPHE